MRKYLDRSTIRTIVFLLFFFSGASALAYEVAWVRELSLAFGVSVYAVTAVLSAFMGGLALGSWLFGRIAAASASPLRLYAALQCGVAVCAALSPVVFDGLTRLYVSVSNQLSPGFYLFNLFRFGLAALVLLVPTTLMGGSFPAMSRFLARREGKRGSDLGFLYAANTIGGVVGTFFTGLFLIRFLGTHTTIYVAAAIDLLVAAAALAVSSRAQVEPAEHELPPSQPVAAKAGPRSRRAQRHIEAREQARAAAVLDEPPPIGERETRTILWFFALSGFAALGYEVIWTRLLSIFTLNTVYSFTIMLTTFLIGLALGSIAASRRVDGSRMPLLTFGYLQLAIGLTSILVLYVFARLPTILERLTNVVSYSQEVMAEFIAGGVTMIVPTLLIGATFPYAARVYASGPGDVGARIGRLYALNTIGAMVGSLVAGFMLIPLLGLQRAALALALLNLALGAGIVLLSTRRPPVKAGVLLAASALAAVLLPEGVYLGFREGRIPQLVYYREGVDATVSVFETKDPAMKISFVNGRSEVPTDRDSMRAFYLLGNLPPLLRPDAKSALMVSFGNGISSGRMARHKVPRIQAVEIVAEQVEAARLYQAENLGVLDYPGLEITIEDGRNYLLRSREQFDIITADATHPVNTSSWALFTREFYTLARQRLAPDGVMIQWLPFHDLSERDYRNIVKTFQSVFPHTSLWFTGGTHTFLVATPRPLTRDDILALGPRIEAAGVQDDLVSAERLAEDLIMTEEEVRDFTAGATVVTDDNAFFIPSRDRERILQSFTPYLQVATEGQ